MIFQNFINYPALSVFLLLQFYMEKTKAFLPERPALFLTLKKPIHNASSQTISRWIKLTLSEGGIDISIFTSHSTRHAGSSAAFRAGVNIDEIRKSAGWSQNSSTFAKFYNRPLVP